MNTPDLYNQIRAEFESQIHFLEDKPEETVDSCIRACWHTAAGTPLSAEEAVKHPLADLSEAQEQVLRSLIAQRLQNKPLAHITGRQNFMGMELLSDERALIPRKETEILGRKSLEIASSLADSQDTLHVMDICCGCGNLGIALAHRLDNVRVYAADLSKKAVELAKENVALWNLQDRITVTASDLFAAFETKDQYERSDLIMCNPPYISSARVTKMNEEIADHEPSLAFDGGMFGTHVIVKFINEAPKFLRKGGWIAFEIGLGQGPFVLQLCERSGHFIHLGSTCDASGNIRVIHAQKPL